MTARILLTGGGTAGSVTPLIALAEQIRRQQGDVECTFIGTAEGPERALVAAAHIPFMTIAHGKWRRYWSWKNISDLGRIWRGYTQAKKFVTSWRPQVVVSAGSFVSVPVVWAAHRNGVPTLIHQQDVRPGLANRLMAPAADRITVAFQVSAAAFDPQRTRWIGNPVRAEVLAGDPDQGRKHFHLSPGIPVLLVLGGGTGSEAMNTLIGKLAPRLVEKWFIIHVTGPGREMKNYEHPRYQAFPFLTWELPHAIAAADVVISRAGLGSLSELAALGKAAIFIPLPHSHQEDNARVVAEQAAGIVLGQGDDIEANLVQTLDRLQVNAPERLRLGNNLHQLYNPQALPQFVDEVMNLLST